MLYIWGKNNNHLFKNNHKKTYSLPQRMQLSKKIVKCACGFDYIVLLTHDKKLHFQYQSAVYHIKNAPLIEDIATNDNAIVLVAEDGNAFITDFNADKIINSEITLTSIAIEDKIKKVVMNYGDIFLFGNNSKVFHLKRNEWYETKTYSDPIQIEVSKNIVDVSPGINENYFLTETGEVYISEKKNPAELRHFPTKSRFVKICSSDYQVGITTKGLLQIWGNYIHQESETPVGFGKITKKFAHLALGLENGFAITQEGTVWAWGKNANGQLGISDYEQRLQPFPLITMENAFINEIYIGQGFTVCIASERNTLQNKKKNLKACKLDEVSINNNTQVFKKKEPSKEFNSFQTFQFHQSNQLKNVLKIKDENKSHSKKPVFKSNDKAQAFFRDTVTPVKRECCITPRSKSPNSQIVRSKTPNSNKRQKENCFKLKKNKQLVSPKNDITIQLKKLISQNTELKSLLSQKNEIIEEITHKIRLLEDAIEQHERSLTARDNLMDEYQIREKQYQKRIQELQSTVEKQLNLKKQQMDIQLYNKIYRDLQLDYSRDHQHYVDKIHHYQKEFKEERKAYQSQIKKLQEEINSFRCTKRSQIQSDNGYDCDQSDGYLENEKSQSDNLFKTSDHIVEEVIQKIEENKHRISKSANKLIELLEK